MVRPLPESKRGKKLRKNPRLQRSEVARIGEDVAEAFLRKKGFLVLERNWRSKRWGELDIIAQESDVLVFVEVKTRVGGKFGAPEEAVTFYKRRALKRAAQYYKTMHPNLSEALRIDVISILLDGETGAPKQIKHLPNIPI